MSKLFTPFKLANTILSNRTIRSAAFESMGKNYSPTEQLKKYHTDVAKGGIGMTTLAYAAVCRSGLSFKSQLWLREEIIDSLKDITDAIHAEGAAASIQLGHCGNMTHYSTAGGMPIGASTGLNIYSPTFVRGMKEKEIIKVAKDFGKGVEIAARSGFDAVELHAGHGYLISQFLSPYTNHRRDSFGGSLDNRMRFMRMCMEEAKDSALKHDVALIVKHNMYDGFKGGIEIPESIAIAREIERLGADSMVLSAGFVSRAPMVVMRGQIPIYTMTHYMKEAWLKYSVRLFGKYMIKSHPFKECYFLDDAIKFRRELKLPLIYVGGITSREGIERVLGEGFELVQIARALVNDTSFVNKLREGDISTRSGCEHSNYCIARMYSEDMRCCKEFDNLPKKILSELEKTSKI